MTRSISSPTNLFWLIASTVDQEISTTSPGNSNPEYLCNDPPNLPNFELDQDMTTDLDRIEPEPTHRLVGETELSSTNTTASWEKIPEDTSGGGRLSRGEEDAIGHLDEGECAQGDTRRTRAKVDSGGVLHSAQVRTEPRHLNGVLQFRLWRSK